MNQKIASIGENMGGGATEFFGGGGGSGTPDTGEQGGGRKYRTPGGRNNDNMPRAWSPQRGTKRGIYKERKPRMGGEGKDCLRNNLGARFSGRGQNGVLEGPRKSRTKKSPGGDPRHPK